LWEEYKQRKKRTKGGKLSAIERPGLQKKGL